jgi:hypothetical protein
MIDIDDYINKLNAEIEHLKNLNQSLRNEIRIQRYEIAQYRDTINILKNTIEMDLDVNN